jgi:hypothetical protein
MQRAVQQQGSGGPDRFFYWPLQDSLRYLGAAISADRARFDFGMALDFARASLVGFQGHHTNHAYDISGIMSRDARSSRVSR